MDIGFLAPTAWTTAALGAGGFLLYAVGGALGHADILLLLMGAVPVAALGIVAFGGPAKAA